MIARVVACLVGIWLMAAPAILNYHGPAQINDRICGPLIASIALIALWEVTRELRWLHAVVGFWLMSAPLVLHYIAWWTVVNSIVCSVILVISAVIPGAKNHSFGGGWSVLFRDREDFGGKMRL
jgi:hypothetical protein